MHKGTILIADDDAAIRTILTQALTRAGYSIRASPDAAGLWRLLAEGEGDLIVTDVVLPDENAFEFLPRIKSIYPELPILVISAQNHFITAFKASQLGAYHYFPKPFDLSQLIESIHDAIAAPRQRLKRLIQEDHLEDMPILGCSSIMQTIYRIVARMTQNDLTIMIRGESGTGKGLIARILHDYSQRSHQPFIAINLATLPPDTLESELFGHFASGEQAPQYPSGRIKQANGGTLFLDEIGDMPLPIQTRFLHLLQQEEYMPADKSSPMKIDFRLIAATSKDLCKLVQQGLFREDLFYRLNLIPLTLPPLREHSEDIADLARHFFKKIAQKQKIPQKHLPSEAIDVLRGYFWPGNIRQLENFIYRLSILYPQDTISADIVTAELKNEIQNKSAMDLPGGSTEDISIQNILERNIRGYFASFGHDLPPPGLYHRIVTQVEYPLIMACLAATRGNQIKTAKILGINRNTLRKKICDLDINLYRHETPQPDFPE